MSPVVHVLQQEHPRPEEYLSLIVQDPGLSLQLLRAVKGGEELDLNALFDMLSLNQAHRIITWAAESQPLPINLPGPDYYLFWRTSLHRSALVRQLAPTCGLEARVEQIATTAFLQETALPMLLLCLSEEQQLAFPGFHVSLSSIISWSRLSLGVDHRMLGQELFSRWKMSSFLLASQQMTIANDAPPDILLLEVARQAVESFYAVEVELARVQEFGQQWLGIDPRVLNESIFSSLESLSYYSLNQIVHEELDDTWG